MRIMSYSFHSSVYIDFHCIENCIQNTVITGGCSDIFLKETECLQSILLNADIEVLVEIGFGFGSGVWGTEVKEFEAWYNGVSINSFEIFADDEDCANNIKFLMTKEQKNALAYLVEYLIQDRWYEEYAQKAVDSLPEPDDAME